MHKIVERSDQFMRITQQQNKDNEHQQVQSSIFIENQEQRRQITEQKNIQKENKKKIVKKILKVFLVLLSFILIFYGVKKTIVYFTYHYQTPQEVPSYRKTSVIITTCCGRQDLLNKSLSTFMEKNTFPPEEIVIVHDGQITQDLLKVYEPYKHKDISLLITGKKIGKLKAMDMAYVSIQTPYIFHFDDDWEFLQKGFIQKSMKQLENDPNIFQVWIQKHHLNFKLGTRIPETSLCLSFAPGLKRLKEYQQIGSYSDYFSYVSQQLDPANVQLKISKFYTKKGKYPIQLQIQYTKRLATQKNTINQQKKIYEAIDNSNQEKNQAQSKANQVQKQYNDYGMHYNTPQQVPYYRKVSVVVTSCCGRYYILSKSLSTFFQKSTFPYQQMFIVNDGYVDQDLIQAYLPYKHNITLLITGKKTGQIRLIDMAYLAINTPYIFHFEDDWQFAARGFIEESINWLENDPQLIQPWIQRHFLPIDLKTRRVITNQWSISFQPGLKRLSNYRAIRSYSKLTKNSSYGTGAGQAETFISKHYVNQGGYAIQTKTEYTLHKGPRNQQERFSGTVS